MGIDSSIGGKESIIKFGLSQNRLLILRSVDWLKRDIYLERALSRMTEREQESYVELSEKYVVYLWEEAESYMQ